LGAVSPRTDADFGDGNVLNHSGISIASVGERSSAKVPLAIAHSADFRFLFRSCFSFDCGANIVEIERNCKCNLDVFSPYLLID
jgi:hypothetical protein